MRRLAAVPILVLLATPARPQDAPSAGDEVRPALAAFERTLDRAIGAVAPPSPMALLGGPGGSRGYHLRGTGAFFVLPPRRLPTQRHVMFFHAPSGAVVLEGPEGRELAERMAAIHAEAERMNAEAERAYRRVRREIRVRLRDDTGTREVSDSVPGEGSAEEPPAPPWRFWFEMDAAGPSSEAGGSADEVVAEVRGALTAALESDAAALPMLGPDEFVAVAVDFVADPFLMPGDAPPRTLVVRVRNRDLVARRRGELSPDELRSRIVYEEY